jgi:uncharacterized protein YyaL (SSP411 family)
MANRLAKETSPYLLQHAHNPVDWYAWGPEAFERARQDAKPILLSVGYSACHWCHVMERESFEDEETARVMNELFVNIKVDREERPDVDSIYMQAVQAMTGHGGWPMTVFLTPSLEPFWGGTYFPPADRHGMPSFQRVLQAVSDAYRHRNADVQKVASSMRDMYATTRDRVRRSGTPSVELLQRAARGLLDAYDHEHGGFGDAPKFPQAMAMEFLLQQWARERDEAALAAVRHTFRLMARGGIYDQIGGGFARYSVDARWLVPHFEKTSYDQALLSLLGAHLWQATQDAEIRAVTEQTLDFVLREMTSDEGGFYSMLDADSEGEEGKFYVFNYEEVVRSLLPLSDQGRDFILDYWGVSPEGNFEGHTILNVRRPLRDAAGSHSITENQARDLVAQAKAILFDLRAGRVRPGADDKVVASWSGLMLRAFSEAAMAFDRADYKEAAIRAAGMLWDRMVVDGRVRRSRRVGKTSDVGFLEDQASVALAFLSVYELTFDRTWFDRAKVLTDGLHTWFWDAELGLFYDTDASHQDLPTRPRDFTDNATPSGNSLACDVLVRMSVLTGDAELHRRAVSVLETIAEPMARYPLAFGQALQVADMVVNAAIEVALVAPLADDSVDALRRAVMLEYVPSRVMAGGTDANGIVLLDKRPPKGGRATAYVCRRFACSSPMARPEELRIELRQSRSLATQQVSGG